MRLKIPKNTKIIFWTEHIKKKMKQYQLSEKRILKVLRQPQRIEIGIAPKTVAAMRKAGTRKHPYEIWVMFQKRGRLRMISAWKYPGESPVGQMPPIPQEILEDLHKILKE